MSEQAGAGRPADTTRTFPTIGSAQPEAEGERGRLSNEDLAAINNLPDGSALLIVVRGPNTGSRFLLDSASTSVGRHTESEIFLDDVTVSRRHAEFIRDTGTFRVRDVGSLNGTYVNRERVDDAALQSGDEVQVGRFRMVFHLQPAAP